MPKKYINRDWRNWNDNGEGVGAKKPTPKPVSATNTHSPTFSPPQGGQWDAKFATKKLNHIANAISPKNISSKKFDSKVLFNKIFPNQSHIDDNLGEYDHDLHMAETANSGAKHADDLQRRINLGKAMSATQLEKGLKVRRLSTVLANVVAKLAEDQNCEPIPGDDEWNIDDLMMRRITKMPINRCRQSRERSNIVLMLDSSPSCSREASFYSSLAVGAVGMKLLDVYDAPNCKVVRKFDYKTRRFKEFMSKEEISAGIEGWDYIRGRTVLFFGDYDGCVEIEKQSSMNKVYWFNPVFGDNEKDDSFCVGNNFSGTIFRCKSGDDFIKILKKLK